SKPGALSPDGQWKLFEEEGQGGGPDYSVYLRRTDGSPAVRLGPGQSEDLSPDGLWALTVPLANQHQIVIVPRGVAETRTLDVPNLDVIYVVWFPDGQRMLLYGNETGKLPRLYVLDSRGNIQRAISPEGFQVGTAIAPDGRTVAGVGPDDTPRLLS